MGVAAPWSALASLVPEAVLAPSELGDAVRGLRPALRAAPATEEDVSRILRFADETGQAVLPRGGGTKSDWGNPPTRGDLLLETERLDRILDHAWADLTVTVQAGVRVAALQATLREHGQRLAIDPLFDDRATIGGILSTNDSGALRLRFGSLRDLVIGATVVLADGTRARSGGRVVKNVAGYDLPKLFTGALGTLGVLTEATFRLHPVPLETRSLSFPVDAASRAQDGILRLLDSPLAPSSVQARLLGGKLHLDVRLEGASLDAQEASLRALLGGGAGVGEDVWSARAALFAPETAVVKVSVLPSRIEALLERLLGHPSASAVLQGTGLGLVGIPDSAAPALLPGLRESLEAEGGSLVVLQPSPSLVLDAWGTPRDDHALMRTLKAQFDPRGTLNPGRFVGGI
jgi:glycolate oxidase FAD binding subunit